jgi:hypothetical protein
LAPALVEAAVAEAHTVTLFNRGMTNPDREEKPGPVDRPPWHHLVAALDIGVGAYQMFGHQSSP